MAGKTSDKKQGKSTGRASLRGGIKKHQKIRTRIRVEQANKESFQISDLNKREHKKKQGVGLESLKTKSLLRDQEKDHHKQQTLEKQKKDTDDHMLRQLEMISGFSL
ncbi:LANO_0G00364g1_1 [Lachancea nothofagi CBS 11611]|uniref:LANO_0G00364g1_1 n=1 Tax=Lachancea nothofagi CBS 11611 TaxID=1266666 RepID=A0A1G4KE64_9SACH|nr:LANO_0G00364g1_1 [Lachancea nothofagi CBS 11611]